MTNFEKIKSMNEERMTEFILSAIDDLTTFFEYCPNHCPTYDKENCCCQYDEKGTCYMSDEQIVRWWLNRKVCYNKEK